MTDKEKAMDKKIKNHEKRIKKLEAFLGNLPDDLFNLIAKEQQL